MQMDRFTIKAGEAVQTAQQLAQKAGNPEVTPLHLLAALIKPASNGGGSIVVPLLEKAGVHTSSQIRSMVASELDRLPKQSGGSLSCAPQPVHGSRCQAADKLAQQHEGPVHLRPSTCCSRSPTCRRRREGDPQAQRRRAKNDILTALKEVRGSRQRHLTEPRRHLSSRSKRYGNDLIEMPPARASSTPSSAATRRSAVACRSSPGVPRTTPC